MSVEVTSIHQTVLYGPYIRIPKGRWKLSMTVRRAGGSEASGMEALGVLRVVKGIPARELSRVEHPISLPGASAVFYEAEFENAYDTGLVETIFTGQPAFPIGTRVLFSRIEMKRLE